MIPLDRMSAMHTVIIQTENGPVTINKVDFDESKHTLAGSKQEEKKPAKRGRPAKKAEQE